MPEYMRGARPGPPATSRFGSDTAPRVATAVANAGGSSSVLMRWWSRVPSRRATTHPRSVSSNNSTPAAVQSNRSRSRPIAESRASSNSSVAGHHADDAGYVTGRSQRPHRAYDRVGDDEHAPERGRAVVVVDVRGSEHETDADGSPPDTDDGGPERPEDVPPVESD